MVWKYNLCKAGGNELQRMVRDSVGTRESLACILEQIQICCRKAVEMMEEAGEEVGTYSLDDLANLIEGEPELCRANDVATIREFGYTNFEELVDDRLGEFYDSCDDQLVWVGTGFPFEEHQKHELLQMGGLS